MLSALEKDRIRVAEIDVQIQNLERSLTALQIEKRLVQDRLDSYTYPVLALPNEVVSEIFIHFLPPYPTCPPLTGIFSPTVLTHICRKWREIAIATPMLWRAIQIDSYYRITTERQAHISDVWLSRSRCCPLSIVVDHHDPGRFLKVFLHHQARWDYLKFDLSLSNLLPIKGPIPLLRGLHLSLNDFDPQLKVAFHDMPMLRTVTLNDYATLSVILPWAQLTSITLLSVYPSECVPILQQALNLVHCSIGACLEVGNEHPVPDIRLPSLESLILEDPAPFPLTGFLQKFLVPALHSLEISERSLGPNPIESLASFISKSGCELQQLRITGYGDLAVSEASYRTAFPSVPRMSFSIYGDEWRDEE
ncbi:F-box domain-containing protein [Mycena venus]|uniref:F-box domain-containing protein n=1 Tax=Mycena venus TaxID=2733690 RepID=A0A8H6X5Q3_9AGAR|nr:F-box domain-containing protein [Mycena venus]